MKSFEYFSAKSLEEVIDLIKKHTQCKILAGGTDLLVKMKRGEITPKTIIDIKRLPELNKIKSNTDGILTIGSLVTFNDILDNPIFKQDYSILYQAAQVMGTAQIRNRATIGGNICNGSPAGDSIPPLICLGAQLQLINQENDRLIPIEKFYEGPQKTCLHPDEILSAIKIPLLRPETFGVYLKLGLRKSLEIAIISICVLISINKRLEFIEDIKISLGSVAPTPIRCKRAEDILRRKPIGNDLIERAALRVQKDINPISDLRSSAEYRYEMAYVLTKKALKFLVDKYIYRGENYGKENHKNSYKS